MEKVGPVVIVAYYWPPSGGPAVQRWLDLTYEFCSLGVDCTVVIPKRPYYPQLDPSLASSIHPNLNIICVRGWEPLRLFHGLSKGSTRNLSKGLLPKQRTSILYQISAWIRGNVFFPDARIFWSIAVYFKLRRKFQMLTSSTLITTGPPHSLHIIGLWLKKQHREVKWMADLRDPISDLGYLSALPLLGVTKRYHQRFERTILTTASAITTTSFALKDLFQKRYHAGIPIDCIPNGFQGVANPNTSPPKDFILTHVGSLFSHRDSVIIWNALKDLIDCEEGFGSQLQIRFVGEVDSEVMLSLEHRDLLKYCVFEGYKNREQCEQFERDSAILLLLESTLSGYQYAIPGKTFSYLKARRPILAIGPEVWDVKEILGETSGHLVTTADQERTFEFIYDLYRKFKSKQFPVVDTTIDTFSRSNTALMYIDRISKL